MGCAEMAAPDHCHSHVPFNSQEVNVNISIIGCGRLGAPYAAGLALMGHQVLGLDSDEAIMCALDAGRSPFDEPGLGESIATAARSGNLRFTMSYERATDHADLHIVCVGTPQLADGLAADLTDVERAIWHLAGHLQRDAVIVIKSSVPVGTTARLAGLAARHTADGVHARLVYSPDFLRESTSLADVACPSRIVLGLAAGQEHVEGILREAWAPQLNAGAPMIVTDLATAELAKVSANAFLATRVSFINAMAALCEATGANITDLARSMGFDPRIGQDYLDAGLGYGGSCLPKDVRSIIAQARDHGVGADLELLVQVDEVNQRRQQRAIALARQACGGKVTGRHIGVWGLAFKPGVDDLRDSPALAVALAIHQEGGIVTAYDPAATPAARKAHPELRYATDPASAVEDAEALLLLTDWPEFATVDPASLTKVAGLPNVIDARGCLPRARWIDAGWSYQALGRA